MTWRIDQKLRNGTTVLSPLPVMRARVTWELNSPGALEVDTHTSRWNPPSSNGPKPGKHELWVYRGASLVWAGPLLQVDVRLGEDDDRRPEPNVLAVARGLAWYLKRRRVTDNLIYTSIPQHTIAWNLIAHTQAQPDGGLGFTLGTHTGGVVNRKRVFCAGDRAVIYDAIDEFTRPSNGIDWEISATRAFNTWQPKRGVALGTTLTGTDVLITRYFEGADDVATYVTAVSGNDCGPILGEAIADAAVRADYGRLHDITDEDADDIDVLNQRAQGELNTRRPRKMVRVRWFEGNPPMAWGTYWLGDTLNLNITKGYAELTGTFRIMGITAIIEPPELVAVELDLETA